MTSTLKKTCASLLLGVGILLTAPGVFADWYHRHHHHRYDIMGVTCLRNTVWSNFEIADLDFWRGEAYTAFFDYLDRRGGFYYEVRPSSPHSPL